MISAARLLIIHLRKSGSQHLNTDAKKKKNGTVDYHFYNHMFFVTKKIVGSERTSLTKPVVYFCL